MDEDIKKFEPDLKFRLTYTWPAEGTQKNCPKCGNPLTLNENRPTYFGKPWWCGNCHWQFTNEEV